MTGSTLTPMLSCGLRRGETPDDAAPEALLSALRAEETRRKDLEQQLVTLPQQTAIVPVDRERVARELRARAAMRSVLLRHGAPARDALQALLLDRVDCTPVLVAGTRGYAFTGDGNRHSPTATRLKHAA